MSSSSKDAALRALVRSRASLAGSQPASSKWCLETTLLPHFTHSRSICLPESGSDHLYFEQPYVASKCHWEQMFWCRIVSLTTLHKSNRTRAELSDLSRINQKIVSNNKMVQIQWMLMSCRTALLKTNKLLLPLAVQWEDNSKQWTLQGIHDGESGLPAYSHYTLAVQVCLRKTKLKCMTTQSLGCWSSIWWPIANT